MEMWMAMKASFFRIGRDLDLPAGSLIQQGKDWLLRSTLSSQNEERAAALWLNGDGVGTFQLLDGVSRCVTLDPALKLELRIDGPIEGPAGARLGSLIWSEDGLSRAICAADGYFMTMDGVHSKEFAGTRSFFALNWSIWIVDKDGKDVAGGPLVTVNS
jgi:hypothetical protein